MKTYTVFAVYEDDNDQRYTAHVEAETPEDAEKIAVRDAPARIVVAGVVTGKLVAEDRAELPSITKIRGRGYYTKVTKVDVSRQDIKLPLACPSCKADLRKPHSLHQGNLQGLVEHGRLPRGEHDGTLGVVVDRDYGSTQAGGVSLQACWIECYKCGKSLWNGVAEANAAEAPTAKKRSP